MPHRSKIRRESIKRKCLVFLLVCATVALQVPVNAATRPKGGGCFLGPAAQVVTFDQAQTEAERLFASIRRLKKSCGWRTTARLATRVLAGKRTELSILDSQTGFDGTIQSGNAAYRVYAASEALETEKYSEVLITEDVSLLLQVDPNRALTVFQAIANGSSVPARSEFAQRAISSKLFGFGSGRKPGTPCESEAIAKTMTAIENGWNEQRFNELVEFLLIQWRACDVIVEFDRQDPRGPAIWFRPPSLSAQYLSFFGPLIQMKFRADGFEAEASVFDASSAAVRTTRTEFDTKTAAHRTQVKVYSNLGRVSYAPDSTTTNTSTDNFAFDFDDSSTPTVLLRTFTIRFPEPSNMTDSQTKFESSVLGSFFFGSATPEKTDAAVLAATLIGACNCQTLVDERLRTPFPKQAGS